MLMIVLIAPNKEAFSYSVFAERDNFTRVSSLSKTNLGSFMRTSLKDYVRQ